MKLSCWCLKTKLYWLNPTQNRNKKLKKTQNIYKNTIKSKLTTVNRN